MLDNNNMKIIDLPAIGDDGIILPSAIVRVEDTIMIGDGNAHSESSKSGLKLVGQGQGIFPDFGLPNYRGRTVLAWFGPPGKPMIQINGPIAAPCIKDIYLICNAGPHQASAGILLKHPVNGNFKRITIEGHEEVGIDIDAYDDPISSHGTPINVGCSLNQFEQINVNSLPGATAMRVGGLGGKENRVDVNLNRFRDCWLGGFPALILRFCDSNDFYSNVIASTDPSSNIKIVASGTPNPQGGSYFPLGNTFFSPFFLGGVKVSIDYDPKWNPKPFSGLVFEEYATEDSEPLPLIHDCVRGTTDKGKFFGDWEFKN